MKKGSAVFTLSLLLVFSFVALGIVVPGHLDRISAFLHSAIIEHFGWAYLLSTFGFVIFCLYLAFSKFGRIKLGKDNEKPQYSYFAWFSMLFAAGMGIGLIFWGTAEPLSHFANPPAYIEGGSGTAAEFAMVHSFFHWGIQPWAIYIVMSLSIAYFSFRRGMPPLISNTFYPLLGERVFGGIGLLINVLAVFATVFGIVTSLGLGALQINGGLNAVFGLPVNNTVTFAIIGVVTVLYMISSLTGLDRGIQILSKTNVLVAIVLLFFVAVVGPTSYILNILTTTIGEYISQFVSLSLSTNPFKGYEWTKSWTLFYWAWWISWSPFVGLFVAGISRGRTIREFISGVLIVPTLLTFVWFSVFGGTALDLQLHGGVDLASAALSDVTTVLFEMFTYLPLSNILSVLAVLLLSVFFITSADSATFVLGMMTSNGNLNPPVAKKFTWGILQSVAAVILLMSGGLEALQRMAIVAALPFTIVMVGMVFSLLSALRYEWRYELRGRRSEDSG
ncbi:MAG: glycine betaine uptake BCCT transporter [Sediminispirochaetaceae bacterium]